VSITDVCVADCDYGPVIVGVQVSNAGGSDVDAGATLGLYAEDSTGPRLVASYSLPQILAGTSLDGIEFDLAPADIGQYGFTAVVDYTDELNECVETNNDDTWSDAWCP
jgi:hypothetical protein